MNKTSFVIVVILATFMAFGLTTIAFAQNGPKAGNLLVHIYNNPDAEDTELQSGVLDIIDWPLTKTWIDSWATMPTAITLDAYADLGIYEVDMNCQAWPTGDPTNKYYKPTIVTNHQALANESIAFRQAVACLTPRDNIITQVLKGYGSRLDVPMSLAMSNYIASYYYTNTTFTDGLSCIYDFDPIRAGDLLDLYNFTLVGGVRQDPRTGTDLKPLIFYVRQDDPARLQAGEMLAAQMEAIGIPIDLHITEKTVCFKEVMVLYNFNLYTGGWSITGNTPTEYYEFFSSDTYYGPTVGWSGNFPGFCCNGTLMRGDPAQEELGFDYWANKVYYPENAEIAVYYNFKAGELFLQYCPSVPLYCSNSVKGYKYGSSGVVNNIASGIDNYYTFLNGNVTVDNTWDYGLKSNLEQLSVIASEWLWDWNVLGLQYDSLTGLNPFNLNPSEFWIANASTSLTWDAQAFGGDAEAAGFNFTIRPNIYWHNVTGGAASKGRNLDVYDINFSFLFTYACGSGIAWNYPGIRALYNVTCDATTNTTLILFKYADAWAYNKAGGLPIVNRDVWGPLWNESDASWKTTVKNYNPDTAKLDDGNFAIQEDGTGAWVFISELKSGGVIQDVNLQANEYFYLSQADVTSRIGYMFHVGAGDVNGDGKVNAQDLGLMARAYGTDPSYNATAPGTWHAWNPDCDLDYNDLVDGVDVGAVTRNYGSTTG